MEPYHTRTLAPMSGRGLELRNDTEELRADDAVIDETWIGEVPQTSAMLIRVEDDGGPAPNPVEVFADHSHHEVEEVQRRDGGVEYRITHVTTAARGQGVSA